MAKGSRQTAPAQATPEAPAEGATAVTGSLDFSGAMVTGQDLPENEKLKAERDQLAEVNKGLRAANEAAAADHKREREIWQAEKHSLTDEMKKLRAVAAAKSQPPAATIESPKPPATMKRAKVTVPNTHVGTIDVEYPADAPDRRAAAIEAAKAKRGIIAFASAPEVEFVD